MFQWTQIFYGTMDEVLGASEVESVASLDSSIHIDKGFCSWLTAIFRIKDENILMKCGPDAVQYLSFQRHIIVYMLIMMVISLTIVLPINFQGELEGDERTFGHTTLSNLDPSEAYPEMEIQDIQLAYDISKVSVLDKEREKVYQARMYCESYVKSTGMRLDMRPYACGNICGCCDLFGCPTVDAIEYYAEEETRLRNQVDEERAAALKKPLGIAFITLLSVEAARKIYDDHRPSCKCSNNPPTSSVSRQLEPHNWQVRFAPSPKDIYWENLSVPSNYWYIKAVLVNFFLFLVLFFLTTPAIVVNFLDTMTVENELEKMAFVDWTIHARNETYRWECLFLPDKGAFFVNYVTTSAFIGTALELIRFPELFVYTVRLCLARSQAETASVRKAILWEFPFGVQYAWMLLIFAMTTMYSLSCPLITPFGKLVTLLVPGSRPYADYSQSALDAAINEVKSGKLSIRKAAEKHSVDRSTLNRKLKGLHMQSFGRPTALSSKEEHHLLQGIITAAEWGFPLTSFDVRCIVKQYLDKKGATEKRSKNNLPGDDWYRSFLQRHNGVLSLRLSENIKRSWAQVSKEVLVEYFNNLAISLQDVPPELIVNFDETNLVNDQGRSKVLVRKGCKHPERILDSSKVSHSVTFAGTASGTLLPPYIVYKAGHIYDTWQEGGPKGA
ncbi:hypothetical protein ANN_18699 [Periplaneta americana]|uniref:4Fe-4S ferredoxin-type domain-containing protein n=1 Tax=Periplaneta americana TaxID=6978 RepID=A0ABQ8SQZ8_PERAM|nr:hypothetical protein ANN_18699 [Periplaneta americana]